MFKKILLAIDGSEHSYNSINYTIELALKFKAKVFILTCYEVPSFYNLPIEKELYTEAEQVLLKAEKLFLQKNIDIVKIIKKDSPSFNILEVEKEQGIDLIVMGRYGNRNIKSFLIGKEANSVLTSSNCSIFLV
ncbi:MAG: universal stress protein [Candidatus Sericytochromatia bacterium]